VGHHVSAVLHHHFKIPMYKTQKAWTGKDVGPTFEFAASPGVGSGATVGTLRTRYPRVQAPSQDKKIRWARVPAYPRGFGSRLLAQGSSGAATGLVGGLYKL
jgi:hypothetical protein